MHTPDIFQAVSAVDWSAVFIKLMVGLVVLSSITVLTVVALAATFILAAFSVLRKVNSSVVIFRQLLHRCSLIFGFSTALSIMFLIKIIFSFPFWIIAICCLLLVPLLSMLYREAALFLIWKRFRKLIYFFRALKTFLRIG